MARMFSGGYKLLSRENAGREDDDDGEEMTRVPSQGALRYTVDCKRSVE